MLAVILSIAILLAIVGAVGYGLWRGAQSRAIWESFFLPLNDGVIDASYTIQSGKWDRIVGRDAELQRAVRIAVQAIADAGVWGIGDITTALRGLHIVLMPTVSWTDMYGRKVAGLCNTTSFAIQVGSDYGALAHEMIEMLISKLGASAVAAKVGAENWWEADERLIGATRAYWQRLTGGTP